MDDNNKKVREPCEGCQPLPGAVNHIVGHVFVGWGIGWQPCPICHGTGVKPPPDNDIGQKVRDMYEALKSDIALVWEMAERDTGPPTVEQFLADEEDFEFEEDPNICYASGWLQGVADTLGMERLAMIRAHVHEPPESEDLPVEVEESS
jgi:hypothetical protein